MPGAIILCDDYAHWGSEAQKEALDAAAAAKHLHIASLPTGQGLLIKPAGPTFQEEPSRVEGIEVGGEWRRNATSRAVPGAARVPTLSCPASPTKPTTLTSGGPTRIFVKSVVGATALAVVLAFAGTADYSTVPGGQDQMCVEEEVVSTGVIAKAYNKGLPVDGGQVPEV